MTVAPHTDRGHGDDGSGQNDRYADEYGDRYADEDDDGMVAMFAPALPPLARRRQAARRRSEPRWEPRPEPRRPEPEPEPPSRPSSPLAELFAEEDAEEAAALAARPERRPAPAPTVPSTPPPISEPSGAASAVAVTVRADPAPEAASADGQAHGQIVAEPVWVGVARGVAGALAAGSLTGAALALRGGASTAGASAPAWLAEFAPLPDAVIAPLLAFCGTALGLFAVKSALPAPPRWGATLAAGALAGVALKAAVTGGMAAGFGPSLAWQIVVCAGLALAATRWNPPLAGNGGSAATSGNRLAPAIGLLVCGLTFPLADGALGDVPKDARGPLTAGRAVAGWWGDALRFESEADASSHHGEESRAGHEDHAHGAHADEPHPHGT